MDKNTVNISLKLYHQLKGDRDKYMDELNCIIEKQSIKIEELESTICIVEKIYPAHPMYADVKINIRNETEFYEKAKVFLGIENEKKEPNKKNSRVEELEAIINNAAGTFWGKLAGLESIE